MPRTTGASSPLAGMAFLLVMVITVGYTYWMFDFNRALVAETQVAVDNQARNMLVQLKQQFHDYSRGTYILAEWIGPGTALYNDTQTTPQFSIDKNNHRLQPLFENLQQGYFQYVTALALITNNRSSSDDIPSTTSTDASVSMVNEGAGLAAYLSIATPAREDDYFAGQLQSDSGSRLLQLLAQARNQRHHIIALDGQLLDRVLLITPLIRSDSPENKPVVEVDLWGWGVAVIEIKRLLSALVPAQYWASLSWTDDATNDVVLASVGDKFGVESKLVETPLRQIQGYWYGQNWQLQVASSQPIPRAPIWPIGAAILAAMLLGQYCVRLFFYKRKFGGADLGRGPSSELLNTLLNALPPGIAYLDTRSRVVFANVSFCQLFSKTETQLREGTLFDHSHPALKKRLQDYIAKALQGEVQVLENNYDNPHGGLNYVVSRIIPDRVEGQVRGLHIISYDSTELIESQKQLSRAVRKNEALMHTINSHLMFGILDANEHLVEVNEYACQTMGMSRHKMLGKTLDDESGVSLDKHVWAQSIEAARAGKIWRGEITTHKSDGQPLCLQGVVVPAYDDNNRLEHIYTLCMNTTQTRLLMSQRDSLNLLFQSVLSTDADIGIITTDKTGIITLFNRGAERMFGYHGQELVNKQYLSKIIVSEKENQAVFDMRADIYSSEKPVGCRRQNGSVFPGHMSTSNMLNETGYVNGYVIFIKDVTDELAAQQQLLEKTDQLEIASEVAGLGVWTWDTKRAYFGWNRRMYEIFEESPMVLPLPTSAYLFSRLHPEDLSKLKSMMAQGQDNEGRYELDFRIYDKVGNVRHLRAKASVEKYNTSEEVSSTGIIIDVTDQLQQEQRLRQAIEVADASSTAKTQFLANMSHEIRTPLNAVLGMLQLLKNTELNELQSDYTASATVAAQSLLELLNSILDFSKIEARKLELDVHSFALDELLQDLAVIVCANQKYSKVRILFDLPLNLPRKLMGDAMRLKQVLLNLIGNAVKFTSHGYVQLKVVKVREHDKNITLRFEVNDTGIGISKKQQEKLFTGFAQAEASTTRKYGGTGLGLAISKRLVDLLGGRINMLSDLGRGTQFWFDLTFPMLDTQPISGVCDDLDNLSAIIISDDPVLARLLSNQLVRLGFLVKVYGESEAIETPGFVPHVVFVAHGWSMPSAMQGWLRPNNIKIIRLLSLSGEASAGELSLSGPYLPSQILRVLRQATSDDSKRDVRKPEVTKRLSGLQLLVVEDNLVNREVARRLLEFEGAEVALAEGGEQGVAMVVEQSQTYDAVLMDIQMPDIDGLEACRRIRADNRFKKLPILALTANASNDDRDLCLAAGMDGHLTKPIVVEAIVSSLLALVRKRPMNDRIPTKYTEILALDTEKVSLIDDFDELAKRFGGNTVLLSMVLNKFMPEVQLQMAELKNRVAKEDSAATQVSLHTLKGVAATVGALRLSHMFAQIEARFKVESQLLPSHLLSQQTFLDIEQLVLESDNSLRRVFIANNVDVEPLYKEENVP